MEHKTPKRRNAAVEDDGVSPTGSRPAPGNRPVSRPPNRNEAPLETYEQPAARGGGPDERGELSRRAQDVERPARGERTARDEP